MKTSDALKTMVELAETTMLNEENCEGDPNLLAEMKKQEEALNITRQLLDASIRPSDDESRDTDCVLHGDSCWITVGDASVYLSKSDDGVSVDVYPLGKEMDGSIIDAWVTWDELKTEEEVS